MFVCVLRQHSAVLFVVMLCYQVQLVIREFSGFGLVGAFRVRFILWTTVGRVAVKYCVGVDWWRHADSGLWTVDCGLRLFVHHNHNKNNSNQYYYYYYYYY
jgi:hypothetical protein